MKAGHVLCTGINFGDTRMYSATNDASRSGFSIFEIREVVPLPVGKFDLGSRSRFLSTNVRGALALGLSQNFFIQKVFSFPPIPSKILSPSLPQALTIKSGSARSKCGRRKRGT